MRPSRYDRERLLFRRQFCLGPRFLGGFPTWRRIPLSRPFFLTAHPDLPVYQGLRDEKSIVLVGYALDPYDALATDDAIVERLLDRLEPEGTPAAVIRSTEPLGGRWVLIVDTGKAAFLFNDPVGYRQVFYARGPSDKLWCASQPGMLAEQIRFREDPDALDFFRTARRRDPTYWWPGDSTLYAEVRHLLPNHYLDLASGMPHRFWPEGPLTRLDPQDVIVENATLLRDILASADRRFRLGFSITAGKDTRLLLAASREIRDRVYYFTMKFWDMTEESPDIKVPSRLLPRLGLTHNVIDCRTPMEREFKRIHRRNVTTAHDVYGNIDQGLYDRYPPRLVMVKGTALPLTNVPYLRMLRSRREGPPKEIDARTLAWIMNIPSHQEFALRALDRWLSEANQTDVRVLDLFMWEVREGNWAAMTQSESDLVHETLAPANCRLFLRNMLSAPEPTRALPLATLHREMTDRLWPEVLSEPINPPARATILGTLRELTMRPGPKGVDWLYRHTIGVWRARP